MIGDLVRSLAPMGASIALSTVVHEGETHQTMLIPGLRRALPLMIPAR